MKRQQKWNLRNPDRLAEYQRRYKKSEKGKAANKRYYEKKKAQQVIHNSDY
jgi:inorganic pyrophosphatase